MARLLILCLVLCALGQVWASVGAVNGVFSDSDRKALISTLKDHQKKDASFGSLEDTYEAVSALLALKADVKEKDDLCKYAKNSLKEAKDAESIFYSVSIAESLHCGSTLSKETATILNEALAKSDLHSNYFAVATAHTANLNKHLGSDFDKTALKAVVKRVVQLAGSEGRFADKPSGQESSYNTALAFQLTAFAASLTDIDKGDISEISDEIANRLEAERLADKDTGVLNFEDESGVESALETTTELLEGIDALARLTGKPSGVTAEHIVGLAQFYIELDDDVSDPEAIHALVTGLNLVAASTVHKPVALVVVSEAITLGSKDQLRVRVTDVFGGALGKLKVNIVRARSRTEESPIHNQAMNADGSTDYVYEFLASKPEQGIYALEFSVTGSGEPLVGSAIRTIRVVSTATVADVTLSVSDSKNPDDANADVRKYNIESNKKLSEVAKAANNSHVHIFLRLKNAAGRASSAEQVAVRLTNQKNKDIEEVFDAVQTTKGYRIHIDVAAAASELSYASGLYKADLLVGDAEIAAPVKWHFADLQLQFPAEPVTTDEPALQPKKAIHHQFRPAAARGSDPISRLFTLLVVSPWALLLVGLLVLGANIKRFPLSGLEPINALAFVASIAAIFFLLYVYWLRLNMFTTLYYLAFLAFPTVFFGSRALRHLNSSHKQKKE